MKRIIALLATSILFQFCTQEKVSPPSLQNVQFGFTMATLPGGKTLSSIPPGTSITISIEKSTGESVLSFKKIELLTFGEEFISAPVSLVAGDYRVTDFLLVNDSSQILFATPKEGSEFAGLVTNPLPVSFSIVAGQSSTIAMEVVDASGKTPMQLGYVSFGLSLVYPLTLTVDGVDHGSSTPISAEIYVLHERDTVQHFSVADGFGTFGFTGDPTKNYYVHAIAPGYFRSIYPLNYNSLKTNNASTLSMVLPPALTIKGFVDNLYDTNAFSFNLTGTAGRSLTMSWGDGITELMTFNSDGWISAYHKYPAAGNFFLTLGDQTGEGDLGDIRTLQSYYGAGPFDDVDVSNLPNLISLSIGLTRSPRIIDLRHNPALQGISLEGAYEIEQVLVPWDNSISYVSISGPNIQPSVIKAESVNALIDAVHHSAVAANRMDGAFFMNKSWTDNLYTGTDPVVELSPQSKAQLKELSTTYHWFVSPAPL